MRYEVKSVGGTIEILASKDFQSVPIFIEGDTMVKAGTPLEDADGVPGILLYDVYPTQNPNGALVVQGIIDAAKAEEHAGITYSSANKAARPGIVFRYGIGVNEDEDDGG